MSRGSVHRPDRRRQRRGRVNLFVLVGGLAVIVPLLVLFAVSFGNDPHEVPSVLEHTPAPQFHLQDLDGKTWDLASLRGKKVVLNFWSTWCVPCRQEHPLLQQAARLYPDVVFLGAVYSDEPAKCRAYLTREGTAYAHLVDPEGRLAIDYGVAGVPETYFIDESGVIAHKAVGPVSAPLIQSLLGPPQRSM
ncbi:MAG: TlpA family protein disulfide reductase [Alphaproteobacteria bacterium]|nr:TlpA family protein disulfide reductase [Alphaproteobacteria bacterium]